MFTFSGPLTCLVSSFVSVLVTGHTQETPVQVGLGCRIIDNVLFGQIVLKETDGTTFQQKLNGTAS